MGVSSCNPGQVFLRDFVEGSLKGMYIFRFGDILWVLWPVAWPAHSRSAAHGRFRLNSRNQGQAFYSALYYAVYSSFVMHSGIQCMLASAWPQYRLPRPRFLIPPTHNRYCGNFYLRLSRRRSRNCRFFLLLNLLTNEFRKANRPKVSTPKGIRKCVLTMTKTLVRSDLASEAIWRPEQPQRFCLKKSKCL